MWVENIAKGRKEQECIFILQQVEVGNDGVILAVRCADTLYDWSKLSRRIIMGKLYIAFVIFSRA